MNLQCISVNDFIHRIAHANTLEILWIPPSPSSCPIHQFSRPWQLCDLTISCLCLLFSISTATPDTQALISAFLDYWNNLSPTWVNPPLCLLPNNFYSYHKNIILIFAAQKFKLFHISSIIYLKGLSKASKALHDINPNDFISLLLFLLTCP